MYRFYKCYIIFYKIIGLYRVVKVSLGGLPDQVLKGCKGFARRSAGPGFHT